MVDRFSQSGIDTEDERRAPTMTLHELASPDAVQSFTSSNKNALICFSATWCGPCKASKPALEEMAGQYDHDVTMDVKFGIVYAHVLGEAIHTYGIRAFPTYVLYQQQREMGRVQGVNLDGIRSMVAGAGCQADLTGGQSLGGGDLTPLRPDQARLQRLAKFASPVEAPEPAVPPQPAPVPAASADSPVKAADAFAGDAKDAADEDVEMKDAAEESAPEDLTANLDKEAIQTLIESMGFALLRAQKGLLYGNGGTIEGAVEWIMEHQDDDDIDEPIAATHVGKAQSYKCNECGRILSNMANLELHANKTGHSDFEESTQKIEPLTAEEQAKKVEEIKALLKAKRAEREEAEKVDEVERERRRRLMGQEMKKTREQLEIEERKRDVMRHKREKEAAKKERERIRAELAKDKAERIANKGKLHSKLGVGGYNPDAIQYDVDAGSGGGEEDAPQVHHKKIQASSAKIDDYIQKVSAYRAGGDGGKCLKILLAYVGNVVDTPEEEKFKTINTENKAYKTKVKPFIGAKNLLLAVGFKGNKAGDALVLQDGANRQILAETKQKLEAALEMY
jgi:thiol-disulfide isomerase/thioredoxin